MQSAGNIGVKAGRMIRSRPDATGTRANAAAAVTSSVTRETIAT